MPKTDLHILNRRRFLGGCAAAAACGACPAICGAAAPAWPAAKAKIRLVFSSPARPIEGWPYKDYDHQGRAREITARLRQECPEIEFVTGAVADEAAGKQILAADRDIDGYMVVITGIPSSAFRPFAFSGRPTVLVDDLYGGTGAFLGAYGPARRQGMPVTGVSSTAFGDVAQGARTLAVLRKLRESVILDVTDRNVSAGFRTVQETLGPLVKAIPGAELEGFYRRADRAEGRQ